MNISVAIERLILDGVPLDAAGRPVLRAAVESELARLLAEGGLSSELRGGGAMPSLRAGGIQLEGQESPAQLGKQIARAVYKGMGR
jgi:hypothetical protein